MMKGKVRKLPPVCLIYALGSLVTGRLRVSREHVHVVMESESGEDFKVFRNIRTRKRDPGLLETVFVVRFKFAKLSFKANKLASILPMLLIAGFPGFRQKIYAVNQQNGYWQGMYQWHSEANLQAYLRSFVYKMMNKRALEQSVTTQIYPGKTIKELIKSSMP